MATAPTPDAATHITVGIDADDTLWQNEEMFAAGEQEFAKMMSPWCNEAAAHAALVETERQRLPIYGYGAKGFVLSMIETAVERSGGEVTAADLARIVAWGRDILSAPVEILPGVSETLPELAERFTLLLITKGDREHQQRKIDESGLSEWFLATHVVAEKDPETYASLLDGHGIASEAFVMVGNSRRSDVDPVLAIGGAAIHLPYHITWALEHAASNHEHPRMATAASFTELPSTITQLLATIEARTSNDRAAEHAADVAADIQGDRV